MKTNMYTVFDRVAEEAGPVFEAVNDGVAIRQFRNLLKDVPSYQHGDFRIYRIGTFDHSKMELVKFSTIDEVLFSEANNAE